MHIEVLQENLQSALQDLQKGVPSRPQLPILSCIYISASEKEILFSVTDLQFGVRCRVDGKVSEPGTAAIPAKVLMDIIGTLEAGNVSLVLEGSTLTVKSTRSVVKIQCMPAEDYPLFPTKEGEDISLPLSVLSPAVSSTAFAASSEESRPILTSLLMNFGEALEIVATDGFRLSTYALPYSSVPLKLLLPARAVSEVVRIATRKKASEVVFTVSEKLKQTFFSFEGVEILVRILEGDFPPYQKIIPVAFGTQLVFDAGEFAQKMKTAQVFARESSGIIRVIIETEELKIVSSSSSLGNQESSMPISLISGGNQEIAFNSKYLQDFLNILKPEKIWMGMNESLKPAVFCPDGMEGYRYIVMPFRVNS